MGKELTGQCLYYLNALPLETSRLVDLDNFISRLKFEMVRLSMLNTSWARGARRGPQIFFSLCLALIVICFLRGEIPFSPLGDWGSYQLSNTTWHASNSSMTNTTIHTNTTIPSNTTIPANSTSPTNTTSHAVATTSAAFSKPKGIYVSGLVFYGRRDRVSIMVKYLEVGGRTCVSKVWESNSCSVIWLTTEDGSTRSCGLPTLTTKPTLNTLINSLLETHDSRRSEFHKKNYGFTRTTRLGNILSVVNTMSRLTMIL